ncbi:MAG TPA: UDP-glucose 4-epimerase GalE [Ignavibacteria bacterium]|nr:UDP-glucose 4-epimerase GalE [Bacteroidota bacterium]HRI85195.1 UDP-glucose 4-epimerase GalE [Ignavibacteria bacterium]HRJ98929.1 UDP-glucose 4-epimerase GalE [Ignavibacteria bacterium]
MKILVTGGTGYIGSHTAVELQKEGYEVIILDNLSNSEIEVIDNIEKISGVKPEFHKIDLCDEDVVNEFFKKEKDISAVIHFAAFKAVGESVNNPLLYYRNNVSGMINLLNALEANAIDKFVYSSSCTVYGEADSLPVTETSPVKKAESPYGFTKQIGEQMLSDLSKISGMKSVILRYFNPTGAHDSSLIGELPIGIPNNLVPYITQTAIGKREILTVNGNDYDTPDGTNIRDYIHVVDLAKAHVIALKRMLENKDENPMEIFNLGTGKGNSVLEVINAFENVTGVKLNFRIGPRREGDVVSIYSDTKKANEILGWKAERDLNDMMLTSWNWQKRIGKK